MYAAKTMDTEPVADVCAVELAAHRNALIRKERAAEELRKVSDIWNAANAEFYAAKDAERETLEALTKALALSVK